MDRNSNIAKNVPKMFQDSRCLTLKVIVASFSSWIFEFGVIVDIRKCVGNEMAGDLPHGGAGASAAVLAALGGA
jgi:hypothetical protein